MIGKDIWKVQIALQNQQVTEKEIRVNGRGEGEGPVTCALTLQEKEDLLCAEIGIDIQTPTLEDPLCLAAGSPVKVRIPLEEEPLRITAFYMFNPWWTRPAFTDLPEEIPEKTQIALFKMKDRVVCLLPMVGKAFKTSLRGGERGEFLLEMTAGMGGFAALHEPLFLMSSAGTAHEAVHKIFAELSRRRGLRLREDRRIPEMLKYLGWCSWDAFYTEVSEKLVELKAEEIAEKKIPFRWILIDDGWFGAREKMLSDFWPDREKFPEGFLPMIRDIKKETSVSWFGVWHALGGYWDGTAPESPAALEAGESIYKNPAGRLVPDPDRAGAFYRTWYRILRREGIDFVKVDGQSATAMYYKNSMPLPEAADKVGFGLESGASLMDGAVINCMGMAMENILARPSSAVSRNSDDFLPAKEESFAEHLIQNAYNALYHGEIYCCDWDMFWTSHRHAGKHSLLRAVSGGPVYVSDKIGATDPEVLKPLTYTDGRVLMLERPARPSEDCIFTDPMKEGVLKIHNCGAWGGDQKAGGTALFNLTGEEQTYAVSPGDIPELDPGKSYFLYDFLEKKVLSCREDGSFEGSLKPGDYKWLLFLPAGAGRACLGLSDKYAGFTALEACLREGLTDTLILKEGGSISWISEKRPVKVLSGGMDVTEKLSGESPLYTLSLPEKGEKAVITVTWPE